VYDSRQTAKNDSLRELLQVELDLVDLRLQGGDRVVCAACGSLRPRHALLRDRRRQLTADQTAYRDRENGYDPESVATNRSR